MVFLAIAHPFKGGARPALTFPGHSRRQRILLQRSSNEARRFSFVFRIQPIRDTLKRKCSRKEANIPKKFLLSIDLLMPFLRAILFPESCQIICTAEAAFPVFEHQTILQRKVLSASVICWQIQMLTLTPRLLYRNLSTAKCTQHRINSCRDNSQLGVGGHLKRCGPDPFGGTATGIRLKRRACKLVKDHTGCVQNTVLEHHCSTNVISENMCLPRETQAFKTPVICKSGDSISVRCFEIHDIYVKF